jgi:hypothetical protein
LDRPRCYAVQAHAACEDGDSHDFLGSGGEAGRSIVGKSYIVDRGFFRASRSIFLELERLCWLVHGPSRQYACYTFRGRDQGIGCCQMEVFASASRGWTCLVLDQFALDRSDEMSATQTREMSARSLSYGGINFAVGLDAICLRPGCIAHLRCSRVTPST